MSAPEVEALVEVAAEAVRGVVGDKGWVATEEVARAALAAVAEPLMALGGERLAEVEAMYEEAASDVEHYRNLAERAEADLAAAEQRGAERALREAADEEDWRGVMFNKDGLDLLPADRVRHRLHARADRLVTQAADGRTPDGTEPAVTIVHAAPHIQGRICRQQPNGDWKPIRWEDGSVPGPGHGCIATHDLPAGPEATS